MSSTAYLLDTNILIEFFTKKPETVALLPKLKKNGRLITSLLSVAEIRMGWSDKEADIFLPLLYDLFETQGLSREIVEQAGVWRRTYKEHGVTLSLVDTLIAATAYELCLTLVTRNRKHFPMSDIFLYPETLA